VKRELAALARHRLAQAHETLAEADQLLASQAFRGAVNRLYYAAFYAARALLALREVDSARPSGLISLFQQHFIKTGLLAAETGKSLARAFEKRQNADYMVDEQTDRSVRVIALRKIPAWGAAHERQPEALPLAGSSAHPHSDAILGENTVPT